MSAKAEESTLPMKEMLKPTGFIAPDSVADKTFSEATEGGATPFSADVTVTENGDKAVFGWSSLTGKVDAMDAYSAIDDNHNWAILDETSKSIIKLEVISNDIDEIAQADIAGHELVACFFVADNATYANISRKYSVTVENPF